MEENAWWLDAACRSLEPEIADELFFPSIKGKKPTKANAEYCSTCPVLGLCLENAIANGLRGFWAGTSDAQRAKMSKQLRYIQGVLDLDEFLPNTGGRRIGYRKISAVTDDHSWMDYTEPEDTVLMLMDVGLVTVDELDKVG